MYFHVIRQLECVFYSQAYFKCYKRLGIYLHECVFRHMKKAIIAEEKKKKRENMLGKKGKTRKSFKCN